MDKKMVLHLLQDHFFHIMGTGMFAMLNKYIFVPCDNRTLTCGDS